MPGTHFTAAVAVAIALGVAIAPRPLGPTARSAGGPPLSVSWIDGHPKISAADDARAQVDRWLAGGERVGWDGIRGEPFLLADRLGIAQDSDPLNYDVFSDASYYALGRAQRRFRLLADYDAALPGARRGELDRITRLIAGATARKAEILVTLRRPAQRRTPTPAGYARGVAALVARFGEEVAYWGTWNEPSLSWPRGPTPGNLRVLADYYARLRGLVGESRLTGPDFVDGWTRKGPDPNSRFSDDSPTEDLDAWVGGYRRAGGGFGVAAALHPYGAITLRRSDSVRRYRTLLPPGTDVWLTEAGARVRRERRAMVVDGKVVDEPDQGRQVEFLLDDLASLPSVRRVYYYGLREPNSWASFDTGLLTNSGDRRVAWTILCRRALGSCSA